MAAKSPNLLPSTQVTFIVKLGGKVVPALSVETISRVNRIPRASVVVYDGTPASRNFPLSDGDLFLPGVSLEILAGYSNAKPQRIFKGVVVKQAIEIGPDSASRLRVEASDEAMKMTLERKNATFEKVKDSDLIGKLIEQNGLKKDVAATKVTLPEVVQYYCSDWDLAVIRAQVNGYVVTVAAGEVTVGAPKTSATPVLKVEFGQSINALNLEMDSATQFAQSAIKSFAWDAATQKRVDSGASGVAVSEPGNLSSADLAKVFAVKAFTQQTGAEVDKASLQQWSNAELLKSKLSKITGSVSFQGSALAVPGAMLELAGIGQRFNGNSYISGVQHSIQAGRWETITELGLSAEWFSAATPNVAAPGASGLLPPIPGLQTGLVKKIDKDPDGEFRVFVTMPLIQKASEGIWARLATFYASNKVGAVFYPQVDDEVVLAFMNNDPRYPVILGSVYSKKRPPPYPPDEKNTKKALVTDSKMEITFDEKDKIIEINTPGKQSIVIDDKAKKIVVKDRNKNTVTLAPGGVTIDSGANITLKAKGNITLDAGGNLAMKAKANATTNALQISQTAKAKFTAKGTASAELSASGIVTVKGVLVKIN